MKSNNPSLFASLLFGALHCARRLCSGGPVDLNGAQAEIIGLEPSLTYDAAGRLESRFILDALIQPASPNTSWQPGALTLLPAEAAEALTERDEQADDLCCVLQAEVLEDRRFRHAAARTCTGVRRVRLNVRVRPGLARLCFRHGKALFGCIVLPEAAALLAV